MHSPWDAFQEWDIAQFGETILDVQEQERWSRAVFLGGLSFMWRKAAVVRDVVYDKLELRTGDRVLLIGEAVEASGFVADIRDRIGDGGEIVVVEIIEQARKAYADGIRGVGGQLATWRYHYVDDYADEQFDCIAVLQGVQHADDWREVGRGLLRVLQPGRRIVMGEIAFGPRFAMRVEADVHISYVFQKLFERIGWRYEDFPYYSASDLRDAFSETLVDLGDHEWRGIELFWGRKPEDSGADVSSEGAR